MRANKNLSKQRGRVVIHSHHTIFIPIIVCYQLTIAFLPRFSACDTQYNCQGATCICLFIFLYQNECKCRLHNSYCNKHIWGQGNLSSSHLHIPNIDQIKYGRYVVWYTRINQKINYDDNRNNFKTRRCIVCTIANDKPIDRFPWIQMDIPRVSVSYLEFKSGWLLSPVCNYISEL